MTGHKLGMLSLRLDAAYCLILGAVVAMAAPSLAPVLRLPAVSIAGVGAAVVLWAGAVAWMTVRLPLRVPLRVVMIANMVVASAIAVFSTVTAGGFVMLGVLAIAADVGLFAGSQAVALKRLSTAA